MCVQQVSRSVESTNFNVHSGPSSFSNLGSIINLDLKRVDGEINVQMALTQLIILEGKHLKNCSILSQDLIPVAKTTEDDMLKVITFFMRQ